MRVQGPPLQPRLLRQSAMLLVDLSQHDLWLAYVFPTIGPRGPANRSTNQCGSVAVRQCDSATVRPARVAAGNLGVAATGEPEFLGRNMSRSATLRKRARST